MAQAKVKKQPTPLERMSDLTQRLVSVPKTEIARKQKTRHKKTRQ